MGKETNLSYRRGKEVNNPLMGNSHNNNSHNNNNNNNICKKIGKRDEPLLQTWQAD